MLLKEVKELLNASVLTGEDHLERQTHSACGADLLSDVLVHVNNQSLLLTGLCNPQVMRTAEMLDIICVVMVRGKIPDENTLELAKERDICVLATNYTMFTASGILYSAGLRGGTGA